MRKQVSASRSREYGFRRAAIFLLVGVLACAEARGQSSQWPPKDLTTTSIEDLMNMEVSSASKKDQALSRTPAAVYVITQEDIQRSGMTSIPELLRMVPGMDVAQINAQNLLAPRQLEFLNSTGIVPTLDTGRVFARLTWRFSP